MILPLNKTIVMSEVLRWAQYRVAQVLNCPVEQVEVKVESGDNGMRVAFTGPGSESEKMQEAMASIHYQAKLMARGRLEGLAARRVR